VIERLWACDHVGLFLPLPKTLFEMESDVYQRVHAIKAIAGSQKCADGAHRMLIHERAIQNPDVQSNMS